MADGIFPGLISKNRDVNAVDNTIFVQLSDGTSSLSVTGGVLDVNASVTIETAYVDDSAFTIGTDKVNAQGFLADETATDSVDEGDIGLARMTLDRRMITSSEQSGTWNIGTVTTLTGITNDVSIDDGGNSITVDASNLDIRDLTHVSDSVQIGDGTTTADVLDGTIDALYVAITNGTNTLAPNADGSINVNVVSSALSDEFHDYDTATVVASGTSNHDYTVVNTTAVVTGVYVGASGDAKFEVQTDNGGGFNTFAVAFTTGKQGDSKLIPFPTPLEGTVTIRVIRTNRENQSQDVYSTIMGRDIT